MNNWLDTLLHGDFGASTISPEMVLLALLLSFALGHVIGWVYMATHVGLSYSQMFVASLVVMPAIVALVMTLMAGDIVIAFGLLAVFAVVRFRNVLKDTRDTTFILWAIVEGLAVGTLRFSTATLGALCLSAIFLYLRLTSFGQRHRYDVVVSMQLEQVGAADGLREILRRHSVRVRLAAHRELPDETQDMSYRILLRDPMRGHDLVNELEQAPGITRVSLHHRPDESEM
jgi:hypothetical protein